MAEIVPNSFGANQRKCAIMNIKALFSTISTIVLDIDGVLTNGDIWIDATGQELRTMHVKDGLAIAEAIKAGLNIWIISGGQQTAVIPRLKRLGIDEIHIKVSDKLALLNSLCSKHNVKHSTIAYMGDDLPDLKAMSLCSIKACPNDAVNEVLSQANWVSAYTGGKGAVRELIEQAMKAQGLWPGNPGTNA